MTLLPPTRCGWRTQWVPIKKITSLNIIHEAFECHMDSESLYCVLQRTHNSKSNNQITNDRKEKKKQKGHQLETLICITE